MEYRKRIATTWYLAFRYCCVVYGVLVLQVLRTTAVVAV